MIQVKWSSCKSSRQSSRPFLSKAVLAYDIGAVLTKVRFDRRPFWSIESGAVLAEAVLTGHHLNVYLGRRTVQNAVGYRQFMFASTRKIFLNI